MVLAWRRARGKAVGRSRIARTGQGPIGRVTADWETGAADAGSSKCCWKVESTGARDSPWEGAEFNGSHA